MLAGSTIPLVRDRVPRGGQGGSAGGRKPHLPRPNATLSGMARGGVRMKHGVLLEDGIYRFTDIQRGGDTEDFGERANNWFYVVLMTGRNREVRRLWESQGFTVSRLKRVRFGSFFIPSAVKAGHWIDLKPKDVRELYALAGIQQDS